MLERIMGVFRLDANIFEEVEADSSATIQAALVVVIVAIASGIGAIGLFGGNVVSAVLAGIVNSLIFWVISAFTTYIVGAKLLPTPETHANWGQLARTIGFAQAPGILRIFGIIPFIGVVAALVGLVWVIIATVIAVRQALDYQSTLRAIVVVIIGYVIAAILAAIITLIIPGL